MRDGWAISGPSSESSLPAITLGGDLPHGSEIRRGLALGDLLRGRAHPEAARVVLAPAQKLAPFDPLLRHRLATALYALGRKDEADKLISAPRRRAIPSLAPGWPSMGAGLANKGRRTAPRRHFEPVFELSPLDPEVACEEKLPPELPSPPEKGAVCQDRAKSAARLTDPDGAPYD